MYFEQILYETPSDNEDIIEHAEVKELLGNAVERAMENFSNYERVKKFELLPAFLKAGVYYTTKLEAIRAQTKFYPIYFAYELLITNAKKSLLAGFNIVLYCAGNYKETYKLIKEVPFIDKFTAKKTSEFYKFLR